MDLFSNHDLSRYGTYRIGGLADFFVEAKSEEDLIEALEWAKERSLPFFVFGAGSNLVFDDEGFRGLVIKIKCDNLQVNGEEIYAEAGILSSKLVETAYLNSLSGLEEWKGLPGTLGGAVFGNAGCFGLECKDILKEARVWIPNEGVKTLDANFFEYEYRNSKLKKMGEGVVLSAVLKLHKGNQEEIKKKMDQIQSLRLTKQPPGLSTGSFFKNPVGEKSAGQLIEEAGLKGFKLGPMQVSEHHANFFLNTGKAKSADVRALAEHVQKSVFEKFGIKLENEVVFVKKDNYTE